jgi:hypothetical protein
VPALLHSAALPGELENHSVSREAGTRTPSAGSQNRSADPYTTSRQKRTHSALCESGDGRNRTGYGSACRARPLLSCHPHGQASAKPLRPAVSWCSHYARVNDQACTRGWQGRQELNPHLAGFGDRLPIRWLIPKQTKPPRGAFPEAAAGKCLLALTQQPLHTQDLSRQPVAARSGPCTRLVSSPAMSSYIHGRPFPRSGQLYFLLHLCARVPRYRPGPAGSQCPSKPRIPHSRISRPRRPALLAFPAPAPYPSRHDVALIRITTGMLSQRANPILDRRASPEPAAGQRNPRLRVTLDVPGLIPVADAMPAGGRQPAGRPSRGETADLP